MEELTNSYAGREQTYIKHQFLAEYLKSASYKILQARDKTFKFVDAFAGPWKIAEDNYSDASLDQAIRTLEEVRTALKQQNIEGLKLRFFLCEKRRRAANELVNYAKQHGSFVVKC